MRYTTSYLTGFCQRATSIPSIVNWRHNRFERGARLTQAFVVVEFVTNLHRMVRAICRLLFFVDGVVAGLHFLLELLVAAFAIEMNDPLIWTSAFE